MTFSAPRETATPDSTPGASGTYRGRFAPSPTGPLHFGSLLAALASFLDARHAAGEWLLRIENLDPPREEPGATRRIIESLKIHGLHWDGEISYQSQRYDHYEHALESLAGSGALFRCACTRAILGPGGNCGRRCTPTDSQPTSARVAFADGISFDDFLLGPQPPSAAGDQVLKRKDGLYAYALAVVVDDQRQGVTHVVRGADLLGETASQISLHRQLGEAVPAFGHIPLLCDDAGIKLSKQTGAAALDDERPLDNLRRALRYLGQPEDPQPTVAGQLARAVDNWDRSAIVRAAGGSMRYPAG